MMSMTPSVSKMCACTNALIKNGNSFISLLKTKRKDLKHFENKKVCIA
jgi:hypothetical protein